MRFSLIVPWLIATTASAPASFLKKDHVVHEKRDFIPYSWHRTAKLHGDAIIPLRIALKQSGLEEADSWLNDVSHPSSKNYGKHWTAKKVAEMFAPTTNTVSIVREWLKNAGISGAVQSQSLNWMYVNVSISQAEKLLKTEYFVYEHESGKKHVACEEYSVPEYVREHIDFVTPTVHFDAKIDRPNKLKRDATPDGTAKSIGQPGSGSLPKSGGTIPYSEIITELENCNQYITPDCLRALYLFPPNFPANSKNSYGIIEYSPQAYLQDDLDLFFKNYSKPLVGTGPILQSIDGGYAQTVAKNFNFNGESDLDLEYAMALVYPQKVTLYQVGDPVEGASFNDFLDALDGAYCAGDDPIQDGIYPDPLPPVTGFVEYEGPKTCGGIAATKVISTSYGYNEHDLTPAYENRQCNEYLKFGLMGTTFLFSSGDYGVAGNQGQCINEDGSYTGNKATYGTFNPSFPGTCPYILSIGATQIVPGASIFQPEEASQTKIYSGGGFSNVFPIPSYQESAVATYFKNHNPPYGPDRYNNSMRTRGFPDVSANGANYVVAIDGNFTRVYGTSASSPAFGSILTLINSARLSIGKSTIGFANPVVYAHPTMFNDIKSGGNQGCGTPGFTAVEGWDPVTGLGTPIFPKMLVTWLGLP